MVLQRKGVVAALEQHALKTPSRTSLRASGETESKQEPQEEGEEEPRTKEQHGQPSKDKENQPLDHTPTDQVSWNCLHYNSRADLYIGSIFFHWYNVYCSGARVVYIL